MMNSKVYLNKNLYVIRQCARSVFKNYFFIISLFLFLISSIIYCVLIILYKQIPMNEALSKMKNLNQIYLVVDFVLITLINISQVNVLFNNNIKSGLYSIEKRAGIKNKEIFIVRYLLASVIVLSLLTIVMILKLIILISIQIDWAYITVDKIMFAYLADIIFSLLILNLLILFFFILNKIFAVMITLIFVGSNVVSPFLFNMNFVGTISNTQKLIEARNFASTNAKLSLGKNFIDFINENPEYEFLIDEFDELNIKRENPIVQKKWELYERIFYFGDIRNPEIYPRLNRNTNTFKMLEDIKTDYKNSDYNKTARWENVMFNKPNKLNVTPFMFLKNLVNSNIAGGKYNKLFSYFINEYDNFFLLNEMTNSTSWKSIHLTGSIFEYGTFDKEGEVNLESFKINYVDPGENIFYWILFQTIRYSISLDSKEIKTLFQKQPLYSTYSIFNIFNYLPTVYNGRSLKNKILDDIYSVNGISFVQTPKFHFNVKMNNDFKQHQSNSGKSTDIRFGENRVSNNELKTIEISNLKTNIPYGVVVIFLIIVSLILMYLGYLSYKKIWK